MTDELAEMGSFVHACEGEMVCESVNPKIPYFNAPIYLENKVHLRIFVPKEAPKENVYKSNWSHRPQLERLTRYWDP